MKVPFASVRLPGRDALVRHLRAWLLLGEAESLARRYAPAQRAAIERRVVAARRHHEGARELSRPRHAASALLLYRAAIAEYFAAIRLGEGGGEERPEPAGEAIEPSTAPAAGDLGEAARAAAERALFALEPGEVDALGWAELHALLVQLDRVAEQLDRQVEPRPVAALRRARALRVGASLAAIGLVAALLVAIVRAPRDLARGRPVSASSVRYGSPAGLVNGSIEWGSFALHTNGDSPAWAVIDLGRAAAIEEVRLYNRGDGWLEESAGVRVELSDDGARFRRAAVCGDLFTQATPCRLALGGARARYVRLLHPSYLALSEVEVLGSP